jgi:two-component system CheB/CheR fusion protein
MIRIKNNPEKGIPKKVFKEQDKSEFPIVGIGASAGGLEALEQFFENMPKDNGMAFVVIQHLDPTHVDIMPELLQRKTSMNVVQASDRVKVKPNCIYVIPPNKSMSLLKGVLHLFAPVESRGLRLPVDFFFRSMADDRQEKSIGIILSGMGSDGSHGIKAIKEKNGIVLVQSPDSAKFTGMPCSALEAVVADIVAPAGELAAKLIAFLNFIPEIKSDPDLIKNDKSNLDKIIILLRQQTGQDFSQYKKNTIFRRIERRKGIHQIDKIHNYVRFLQENPKEVELLSKELLIGVTSFFRDTAVWKIFKEKLLPELIKELPEGYVLRAWVPGCSTGEEAFSLAIVFKEVVESIQNDKHLTLQIFASDLDPDAIEIARKGVFKSNIASDVSPERLSRFFTVEAGNYRVHTTIRDMVVFASQNIIKDPPFTRLDLLMCRNLLIYMEPELQLKLITLFHYSLNPGGILLLGMAETLGNKKEGFEVLDSRLKFFRRSITSGETNLVDFPSSFSSSKKQPSEIINQPKVVENIQSLADQILLQRFAPASVLVNTAGDIINITGHTGKYLEPVAGKANWNIFVMVRNEIRVELPVAFRKAIQTFDPVIMRNIKVENSGVTQFVDISIQRIEGPDSIRGLVMIVFTDVPALVDHKPTNFKTRKRTSVGRMKELEIDLKRSYEELQSTQEEMKTSQEELKSTNEELQSTNEELQSTNEELTTSKEEMQSMNEELQTINTELQNKVSDYIQANDDMKNLLNSTEIATLFLDKELNIRRFTDTVAKIVKLRSTDTGRPFTDLVNDFQYPEIGVHARQVIKTLISVETDTVTNDGRWFTVRIMPYRTLDDRIDGLVITFIDITVAKKLEIELQKANEILRKKEKKR